MANTRCTKGGVEQVGGHGVQGTGDHGGGADLCVDTAQAKRLMTVRTDIFFRILKTW